ncbi:MAG: TonB-dependent receptor [Bacteroidales bacterium]|nr:TonB-dependent receptor [Bacteroidales bacterium]
MRNSTLWKSGILSLLLFGFAISMAYSQDRTVTGKVTSVSEGSLPGVNIVIQGTVQGAVTDVSGNYSIVVPGPDATLVFSFIGYTTQAVTIGSQSTIDVVLNPDVTSLEEIVVTAYATQKKKDLTGAVGVINSDELVQMPQGNITQQMQGRVAGVTVQQDARPGQPAKIRIRGYGSFQDNDPLYIVDGVPTSDVNTINPADVESISVLKDAGAASIYGSRASNGVIVITTKKGKPGMNVNYNMYIGTQRPGSGPDNMLNAQEYMDLQWLVYDNDELVENHPIYNPTGGSPTLPFWAADTKWWDEVTQNAPIMNHDLSLSGGNDNSKYYASFGYFDQQGTTLESWAKRFSTRFNSEFKIKDRVTIGENINIVHRSDNGVENQAEQTAVTGGVYRMQPIIPVIWDDGTHVGLSHTFEDGDWGSTGISSRLGNGSNYVATRSREADDKFQSLRILGNVFADVKILEGLNFRTSFGGSINNDYETNWTGTTYEDSENVATATYQEQAWLGGNWTWTNTLTLAKQFGDHSILAVAGYEAGKLNLGRNVEATGAGYFSETYTYRTVSSGSSLLGGASEFDTPRSLVSQFLRADYNFRAKYYLSGTVRRDGSSVFGSETRYGVFPSVSAGWRVSEESFLAGASFISDLKIRGGYGTMGNQLAVETANQFFLYGGTPDRSFYDLNGTTNSSLQGFRPTRIGNPDAKWETNVTTNVGFDAVLLDRKLELVFDWYMKKNLDLLYDPELPGTAGSADRPFVNVGEMKNTGIDLQLIFRHISGDFSFEANATFTTYNNEIIKIAEGYESFPSNQDGGNRIGNTTRNEVGYSMGEFYGYNVLGLFQSQGEVDGAAVQDGAEAGFFRYEDVDESGTIDDEDRMHLGNPNPDFTYGLNLVFGYKGFDVTAFFYGSQGNDILNQNKWWLDFWPSFQGQKSTDLLNSWTPSNTSSETPKASNKSNFSTNAEWNSYYVEDGSFFRMKNLQIGYTFDRSMLGNVFANARIYVQATNLFTITKYTGLDPELHHRGDQPGDQAFGVDQGSLPAPKQFLVGVSLGF